MGFRIPWPAFQRWIYDGDVSQLTNLHLFFQLSRRIFLPFSNFNRNFFWFFKFRAEKKSARKISRLKNPAGSIFNPKIFGRKKFQTVRAKRDRPDQFWAACTTLVVKPATKGTFSNFRGDLFEIFWRESSYKRKISGPNAQKKVSGRQGSYFPPTFLIRSIASLSLSIEAAYESRIHPGA